MFRGQTVVANVVICCSLRESLKR